MPWVHFLREKRIHLSVQQRNEKGEEEKFCAKIEFVCVMPRQVNLFFQWLQIVCPATFLFTILFFFLSFIDARNFRNLKISIRTHTRGMTIRLPARVSIPKLNLQKNKCFYRENPFLLGTARSMMNNTTQRQTVDWTFFFNAVFNWNWNLVSACARNLGHLCSFLPKHLNPNGQLCSSGWLPLYFGVSSKSVVISDPKSIPAKFTLCVQSDDSFGVTID